MHINREGYWYSSEEIHLPAPRTEPFCWPGWLLLRADLELIENNAERTVYRGISRCRICGCANGAGEFKYEFDGCTWVWPSGYMHYINVHKVRPSLAFQEFITRAATALGK